MKSNYLQKEAQLRSEQYISASGYSYRASMSQQRGWEEQLSYQQSPKEQKLGDEGSPFFAKQGSPQLPYPPSYYSSSQNPATTRNLFPPLPASKYEKGAKVRDSECEGYDSASKKGRPKIVFSYNRKNS